jgi:N6-adenosine-specific RNA methylase IME4
MPPKYDIIYSDPPWHYKGQTQHAGAGSKSTGGAQSHYRGIKLARLKQLDVPSICAPDCLMFMWTSSPHLDQAIELLKAWGFKWATVGFVWDKQRLNPGSYTVSQIEMVLIGKRGRIPQPRGARNMRQFLSELRGEHSEKPAEVRNRITAMFPTQRRIELFARTRVRGWAAWGDEVKSTVQLNWKTQ